LRYKKIDAQEKSGRLITPIYADETCIEQVLSNLIINAIKYSPEAGKIKINISNDTKHVTISVQDFGRGIAKKDQLKIFERYYRTGNTKQDTVQGFGLGLYIVAEIIKLHGGKISVDSKIGKGSTFSIELPIYDSSSQLSLQK
jgi:signal transduction histidine kinase